MFQGLHVPFESGIRGRLEDFDPGRMCIFGVLVTSSDFDPFVTPNHFQMLFQTLRQSGKFDIRTGLEAWGY
jgi:hypothetical protein